MAFDLMGEIARVADFDLTQLDVLFRQPVQRGRILVGDGDVIIACCSKEFCDGDTDFAAAYEHHFFHGFLSTERPLGIKGGAAGKEAAIRRKMR